MRRRAVERRCRTRRSLAALVVGAAVLWAAWRYPARCAAAWAAAASWCRARVTLDGALLGVGSFAYHASGVPYALALYDRDEVSSIRGRRRNNAVGDKCCPPKVAEGCGGTEERCEMNANADLKARTLILESENADLESETTSTRDARTGGVGRGAPSCFRFVRFTTTCESELVEQSFWLLAGFERSHEVLAASRTKEISDRQLRPPACAPLSPTARR